MKLENWKELSAELMLAGVRTVEATYSGAGDEGYIDECVLYGEDREVLGSGSERVFNGEGDLTNEVMGFVDQVIDASGHAGYENNEGGGGNLLIDLSSGVVRLHHYDFVEEQVDDDKAWGPDGIEIELPHRQYASIKLGYKAEVDAKQAAELTRRVLAFADDLEEIRLATVQFTGDEVFEEATGGSE